MSTQAPKTKNGRLLAALTVILALAGIGVSIELTYVHVVAHANFAGGRSAGPAEQHDGEVAPAAQELACDLSESVSCSDVALAEQSEFLGVPISIWGILAYVFLLGAALLTLQRREAGQPLRGAAVVFLVGAGSVGYSLYLAAICVFVLQKLCIWCTVLYGINALLLVVGILLVRRAGGFRAAFRSDCQWVVTWPVRTAVFLSAFAIAATVLLVTRSVWQPRIVPLSDPQQCGDEHQTTEGFPLLGAPDALVTIEEYSDYECGFCRRAHETLRAILTRYGERVRMIHRNFPLDQECNPIVTQPFHRRACAAARAAVCAADQGKFWTYSDQLWANQRRFSDAQLRVYAERVGLDLARFDACLEARESRARLEQDVRAGMGWQIRGTPTFIINGQLFKGAMNEEKLSKVIDEALARCGSAPPSAPPPAPATEPVAAPAPVPAAAAPTAPPGTPPAAVVPAEAAPTPAAPTPAAPAR